MWCEDCWWECVDKHVWSTCSVLISEHGQGNHYTMGMNYELQGFAYEAVYDALIAYERADALLHC